MLSFPKPRINSLIPVFVIHCHPHRMKYQFTFASPTLLLLPAAFVDGSENNGFGTVAVAVVVIGLLSVYESLSLS